MKKTDLIRKIARVLVPLALVVCSFLSGWLALMFAWLTATPGDPGPRQAACYGFCAGAPLCLVGAGLSIWLLRPHSPDAGAQGVTGFSPSSATPASRPASL